MKLNAVAVMVVAILLSAAAGASERQYQLSDGRDDVLHGQLVGVGKAARDTTWLLGGPDRLDGKFQDAYGDPAWHGWTHLDATYDGPSRWHVSDYHSPTGTPAMWCGQETFPSGCGPGYGNSWNEWLVFTYTVADPGANTVARLECVYNWDCEPGFDYFRIQQNRGGTWETIIERDNIGTAAFDQSITFTPSDYVGPAADRLELRFEGFSDGAWSDEDCLYDTDGLAQVDDIHVTIGAETFVDDFNDGASHHWTELGQPGCGDFAQIWRNLLDVDPCVSNTSAQVAFIDDGLVVPGTGGTPCITWCYGPGGYIVNSTGGLVGPEANVDNLLISPVMAWPAGNDGAVLTFDAYAHEDLVSGVSPGIFYQWHVRSATDLDDLAAAPWEDRNFVYYGRGYRSEVQPVTDLVTPGRTHVQVALRCVDYGWLWGEGIDGTPAPYFDNVAFKVFSSEGPTVSARAIDLAQDSFPERGELDLGNLANNWVRFDMARSIAPDAHLRNDPGDSIIVDFGLPRAGSVLNEMPKLVVKMKANPVFDGVRVLPANFTQSGEIVDGWVYGDSTRAPGGWFILNRYHFDLPDSDFFFPGDIIHYYLEASDYLAGDVGTTTLPADLADLSEFRYANIYPEAFTVRALPTLQTASGYQPEILFWNDGPSGSGVEAWFDAFRRCNYSMPGEHFDVYETDGPSSGVGNGLGGRATSALLSGYEALVYTCGDLGTFTLGYGYGYADPSDDLAVLTAWFEQGGKHAFMTGDDLVQSLGSAEGQVFRQNYLGVDLVSGNIMPLIGNQVAPRLRAVPGNSIALPATATWIAGGGCPGINDFDAVAPRAGAETVARFCNPGGQPDYPYAGAWRFTDIGDVVALPYDLTAASNALDWTPPPPTQARAYLLNKVLLSFGQFPPWDDAVPEAGVLTVSAYPNPFNPRTTIALVMPQSGDAALKLYDIRGRLVRTLHDGPLAEGRHDMIWNGDDDAGRALASGVYFYEVRAAGNERIGKLALVR